MTNLFLVVGGDRQASCAEVLGVYTTYDAAMKAAAEAGRKVRAAEEASGSKAKWFGCTVDTIKVDAPVRSVWKNLFISEWNGERSVA